VGHVERLNGKGANVKFVTGFDDVDFNVAQQIGTLELDFDQAGRQLGGVDRGFDIFDQMGQGTTWSSWPCVTRMARTLSVLSSK
jgi:hypothetical protein